MALLSTLVKAIADVEGIDEVQVGWVARHLREAGHISQAGRGRGAAQMSSSDAANLLIGVNAATGAKNGAEAVSLYRSLPCGKANLLKETRLSEAFKLGQDFGRSLEVLLELSRPADSGFSELVRCVFAGSHFFGSVSADRFDALLIEESAKMEKTFSSEITFSRPYPNVSVLISDNVAKDVLGRSILDEEDPIAEIEFWDRASKWPLDADRDERVRISLKTVIKVGNVLTK